jgi:hypothetical protein
MIENPHTENSTEKRLFSLKRIHKSSCHCQLTDQFIGLWKILRVPQWISRTENPIIRDLKYMDIVSSRITSTKGLEEWEGHHHLPST